LGGRRHGETKNTVGASIQGKEPHQGNERDLRKMKGGGGGKEADLEIREILVIAHSIKIRGGGRQGKDEDHYWRERKLIRRDEKNGGGENSDRMDVKVRREKVRGHKTPYKKGSKLRDSALVMNRRFSKLNSGEK